MLKLMSILGCGGIVKNPNIKISPPTSDNGGHGTNYGLNKNCKWIIVAPPNSLVELSFTSFDLEDIDDCFADYVEIYDGIVVDRDNAGKPIGKYCGTNKPPTMLSTSHAFTIFFRSDESITGEGFEAKYEFIDEQNCKYNQFRMVMNGRI